MIPLATHPVAASTLSATVHTTHFAISPALSIAHHARSPTPQSRSHARPPAPLAAFPSPQATQPAASATHQTTEPAASVAPFATDHAASTAPVATLPAASTAHLATSPTIFPAPLATSVSPHATHPAIAQAELNAHPSILSSEKSPAHINTVSNEPIRINSSFGSIPQPVAFHAKSIMIAHTIPANLVLYHRIRAAPASISPRVAIQNQIVFGRISRKGISCAAAPPTKSILPGIPPNLPNQARSKSIPATTRIIQSTFHIMLLIYKLKIYTSNKVNLLRICKENFVNTLVMLFTKKKNHSILSDFS